MKRRTGERSWYRNRFVSAGLAALASTVSTSAGFAEPPKPWQIVCVALVTVLAYRAAIDVDQDDKSPQKNRLIVQQSAR
jgi:hypothetical protein